MSMSLIQKREHLLIKFTLMLILICCISMKMVKMASNKKVTNNFVRIGR
uniref:Hypotheticial protein n=1 Tax=Schistosoma japonicum TaxID=6182 RepID=C1LFK1_SCHJA|nr:hypotheticial protein [Schistosoma japonicum]